MAASRCLLEAYKMKPTLIAGIAALVVVTGSEAFAQSAVVEIAPEQRTRIKEYVVKERVRPVTIEDRVTVGATLPAEVQLTPVPPVWGPTFVKYRYIYTDDRVVLVEPSSRRVVQIIE
jgi:hypothetical protein